MRTLTAAEKVALLSPHRHIEVRVYIARSDGVTWVELTHCPDGRGGYADRVLPSSIDEDLDRRTRQLSLTLAEDASLPSLSPLDESSALNQHQGIFDPLLTPVRECQVKVAITDGRPPREGDFKLWFHGYLGTDARPNTVAGTVEVTVNDLAKRLQVTVVTEAKTYAEGTPTDIEDILQQIIDDHLGSGVVELYVPVSPAIQRQDVTVKEGPSVWDALQELVDSFGWDLRYRYDEAADSFRLTLQEPPRDIEMDAAEPVLVISSDNVLLDESANVTDDALRNRVTVRYYDPSTGQQGEVIRENLVSQQAYWLRPMLLSGNEIFPVKNEADAVILAEAILADLQDLRSTTELTCDLLPWLEIHDIIAVRNRRIRDKAKNYAVAGVTHEFGGGTFQTTITAYTQVRGAVLRWLKMEHRPGAPGKPPDIPETRIVPAAPGNLRKVGEGLESVTQTTLAYVDLAWEAVSNVLCDSYLLQYRKQGTGNWETLSVPLATGSAPQRIHGLPGNIAYEFRVAGMSRAGVRGVWSAVLPLTTLKDAEPPAMPSGLQASSITGGIAVGWSRPLEPDYSHTVIRLSTLDEFNPDDAGQVFKEIGATGTAVEITEGLAGGTDYYARVQHVDTSNNPSPWSAQVSAPAGVVTETPDLTPPPIPTGLAVMTGLRKHVLVWDRHQGPPPLDRYEVQYATRPDGGAWSDWTTASDEVRSGVYSHEGLDLTLEYRYRMRAVSRAGVASDWSEAVEAGTPGKVSLSEEVVGQLVREQLGPGVRGDLNQRVMAVPDDGVLWPFDQSLQSTRGIAPIAGSGTIYPADGVFSGALRTQVILAYPFAGMDYTVSVYRDKGETWESYADLTWQQLIALLEVRHA